MNRQERDTICGVADRYGLSCSRILGYALKIEGYIFLDFEQARKFVNQRLNLIAITPEHAIVRWNRVDPQSIRSTGFFRRSNLLPVVLIVSLGVFGVAAIIYGLIYENATAPTPVPPSLPKPQLVSSVPPAQPRPSQITVAKDELPMVVRVPDKITFKGVAGTLALVQIVKSGEAGSQNRQLAQGDEVLRKWIVKSIATRPTLLTLRNDDLGKQIEIHLNESIDLPTR